MAWFGCSFSGANAFRHDLTADQFATPFTAEHHYRPPRYDAFVRGISRHPKDAGPYCVFELMDPYHKDSGMSPGVHMKPALTRKASRRKFA